MKPGDLVRVTGLISKHGELGVIVSELGGVLTGAIFYDVMLADGLDFLKGDWLEVVDESTTTLRPATR
jgi:hypothetical protein